MVKCAHLRTIMWPTSTEADVMPGTSNRRIGSMIRLVCSALKADVESINIKELHAITGNQSRSIHCGDSVELIARQTPSRPPHSRSDFFLKFANVRHSN
jgi:hypothetical protein